ncbi:MAG: sugar transferase [Sphingobacteriales bacterium JAD_PAG50586_3]|nr:MAG: sugar transferase [Sphingobacteriales bacterium JAD_PAG50586_3]
MAIAIAIDSRGGVFFLQIRVGKDNKDFKLFKFRTMRVGAESKGQLTIGGNDSRITRVGYFLRKYKIDELPQLLNVLLGDMSLVGPRPEVRRYVAMYNAEQMQVLSVKPGLTDYASIKYADESELLARAENPEQFYIDSVMPDKLAINLEYIKNRSLGADMGILFKTIGKILS